MHKDNSSILDYQYMYMYIIGLLGTGNFAKFPENCASKVVDLGDMIYLVENIIYPTTKHTDCLFQVRHDSSLGLEYSVQYLGQVQHNLL